jgi:eukaryotic-like serine/threonine-protein kinase
MATVHLARLMGSVGFSRTVAIKRLHPHLAKDPDFVNMFLEEARLAARVRHPNVVATLDVVCEENELFLVMEYIAGESLSRLIRKTRDAGKRIPPRFVASMMCSALDGLQAAHDATSERGAPLGIVHRDVSPQNIHVGLDGVARVLDFGIAKATNRVQETRSDQIKGKVQYMAPEQLAKGPIDRRADVYSASVVLWEALTGRRLFKADDVPALVYSIINDEVEPPSSIATDLPPGVDAIVLKGLDRQASNRWSSAREMAVQLERVLAPAPQREISEWMADTAGEALAWRIELVHRIESESSTSIVPPLRSDLPPGEAASGVVTSTDAAERNASPERLYAEYDEDKRAALMRPEITSAGTETRLLGARSRLVAASAVLLLLTGAAALALRLIQLRDESPAASPPPTAETEPAIGLGIARTAPSIASAAAAASSAATPSAAAPVTATQPARAPVSTATRPEGSTTRTPTPSPPAPIANDCDNPFTVDAKGLRHPKPHCFKR